MNLFLIGYRCSGKTTIGKSIAATLAWSFVDADSLLMKACGKHIRDIIDTEGWEAFRRLERSILRQICSKDRQVVATGGGVVLDTDNVKAMKTSGFVVWLDASAEAIRERMLQDETTRTLRPPLTDKGPLAEIEDMLLVRNPHYENASDFLIHTDHLSINEINQRIIERLNERGSKNIS